MGYQVGWADREQTIVVQKYSGDVQTREYYQMTDKSAELLSSVEHPVDIILDTTEMKSDLKGFLQAVSYANKKVPENQRLVVVVGANRFMQTMGNIARSIAPKATEKVYFVDTLPEAHKVIEAYRQAQE